MITRQPQSAAVALGERLVVSVAATGGGLTYEWRRDGSVISPETAEIAASNFVQELAGSYTVTVKNSLGSVTSEPAVISVASPPPPIAPPPVSPPPANSSSGGGGGALPGLFAGGLAMLALVRAWPGARDRGRRNGG